ncbi:SDR family oxidoreductase [Paenibacillus doosanensis]|uniref:dTDP-4-dehydrorhamnose reductase n=1 Tax=Paenibacillus konkukensis TaxID=2020716 RepID=A0ABY4RW82_9BACL|nr:MULTISPECIES: SDR family oxidoreductase [Paenibacillus]MCS7458832.1 SDR family oxidoreductase [Paenibacillus doosanensis]UQZ86640.1 dTDP-4-dehydrorhamnose reductase [Paenibacillus konkukensis]
MRVLVTGGGGMAGHMLVRYLSERTGCDVFYTIREQLLRDRPGSGLYLEASDDEAVKRLIEAVRPDVVVNCIGILNDNAEQKVTEAYRINGLLPHLLAEAAERVGGRLIHISTDCVFSGDASGAGAYEEDRVPDGTTVYARTKALGEVLRAPHLTVRTSIIGPEIRRNGIGLMQWFMKQRGTVQGFVRVRWNGVTTLELAKFIRHALERGDRLTGLVHLTAPYEISKYGLLKLIQDVFGKRDVCLEPRGAKSLDRTLRSTRADLEYPVPGYPEMLKELRDWIDGHAQEGEWAR